MNTKETPSSANASGSNGGSGTAHVCLAQISTLSLQVIRALPGEIATARHVPLDNAAMLDLMLNEACPSWATDGWSASISVFLPATSWHLVSAEQLRPLGSGATLGAMAAFLQHKYEGDLIVTGCAPDGAALDAGPQDQWLVGIAPADGLAKVMARTERFHLRAATITPGVLNHVAVIRAFLSSSGQKSVVLFEPGLDRSHLFLVTADGVQAVVPCELSLNKLWETLRAELNLKFALAASRLFFSDLFDFSESGPKICAKAASEIAPAFEQIAAGLSERPAFSVAGFSGLQNWFSSQLSAALSTKHFDVPSAAFFRQLNLRTGGDLVADNFKTADFGLIYRAALEAKNDHSWQPIWTAANLANFPLPLKASATPAPALVLPVVQPAPAPVTAAVAPEQIPAPIPVVEKPAPAPKKPEPTPEPVAEKPAAPVAKPVPVAAVAPKPAPTTVAPTPAKAPVSQPKPVPVPVAKAQPVVAKPATPAPVAKQPKAAPAPAAKPAYTSEVAPASEAPKRKVPVATITIAALALLSAAGGYFFLSSDSTPEVPKQSAAEIAALAQQKAEIEAKVKAEAEAKAKADDAAKAAAEKTRLENEAAERKRREEAELGRLEVSVSPAKAEIFIGDSETPASPESLKKLQPGLIAVHFRLAGYRSETQLVEITAGRSQTLNTVILQRLVGSIEIQSSPSGLIYAVRPADSASATLLSGETPSTLNQLPVGEYLVSIRHKGSEDYVEKVTVTDQNNSLVMAKFAVKTEAPVAEKAPTPVANSTAAAAVTEGSTIKEDFLSAGLGIKSTSSSFRSASGLIWRYNNCMKASFGTPYLMLRGDGLGTISTIAPKPVKSISVRFRTRGNKDDVKVTLLVAGSIVATSPAHGLTFETWEVADLPDTEKAVIEIRSQSKDEPLVESVTLKF